MHLEIYILHDKITSNWQQVCVSHAAKQRFSYFDRRLVEVWLSRSTPVTHIPVLD